MTTAPLKAGDKVSWKMVSHEGGGVKIKFYEGEIISLPALGFARVRQTNGHSWKKPLHELRLMPARKAS
jgi:hypothetical protein